MNLKEATKVALENKVACQLKMSKGYTIYDDPFTQEVLKELDDENFDNSTYADGKENLLFYNSLGYEMNIS